MLYPIAIERGDDRHAFAVTVPDIPGCFSAGETLEEALANAREAIEGHLSVLADDSDDIPLASSIEECLQRHPELATAVYIWAVVELDVSRYLGKAEKINVTLPGRLIHKIDQRVAGSGQYKTRSGFLAAAAEYLLQRAG